MVDDKRQVFLQYTCWLKRQSYQVHVSPINKQIRVLQKWIPMTSAIFHNRCETSKIFNLSPNYTFLINMFQILVSSWTINAFQQLSRITADCVIMQQRVNLEGVLRRDWHLVLDNYKRPKYLFFFLKRKIIEFISYWSSRRSVWENDCALCVRSVLTTEVKPILPYRPNNLG